LYKGANSKRSTTNPTRVADLFERFPAKETLREDNPDLYSYFELIWKVKKTTWYVIFPHSTFFSLCVVTNPHASTYSAKKANHCQYLHGIPMDPQLPPYPFQFLTQTDHGEMQIALNVRGFVQDTTSPLWQLM